VDGASQEPKNRPKAAFRLSDAALQAVENVEWLKMSQKKVRFSIII
jgi:hypothetical protein